MATTPRIRIKTSNTTAKPANLLFGELAFTGNGSIIYIGAQNGEPIAIGGMRTPGVLTANQAIVANSTGYVDQIKTIILNTQKIQAGGSIGSNGQVLVSRGANSSAKWEDLSNDSSESLMQYIDVFCQHTPAQNEYILIYPIINNFNMLENFANSVAYAETVANTTNQIFGVFKNNTLVGNIVFNTSTSNGMFSNCDLTSFIIGDLLKIKSLANADNSFSNFSISIKTIKENP
jgi:hypothetical protein